MFRNSQEGNCVHELGSGWRFAIGGAQLNIVIHRISVTIDHHHLNGGVHYHPIHVAILVKLSNQSIDNDKYDSKVCEQSWTLGGQRPLAFSHMLQVGRGGGIIFYSQSRTKAKITNVPPQNHPNISFLTRDSLNGIGTFESRRKQPRVDPKKRINERFDPDNKKEETDAAEDRTEEVVTTLRPRKTRELLIFTCHGGLIEVSCNNPNPMKQID